MQQENTFWRNFDIGAVQTFVFELDSKAGKACGLLVFSPGLCFRPDDACQMRFSWFSEWIQKVQKFESKSTLSVHCVDLGESLQTHIYLQNFVSIQPRTSPLKFAGSRDVACSSICVAHGGSGPSSCGVQPALLRRLCAGCGKLYKARSRLY